MVLVQREFPDGPRASGTSLSSPLPVPWDGALARARASVGARRLVPTWIAMLGTDLLYQLLLRLSQRRMTAAIASMEAVVGRTPAESSLVRLARSHVAAQARGWELTWRPWELEKVPIRGVSRIHRARATGRGLIMSHVHMGPLGAWVPLARLLRPLYHPAGDWVIHPPKPGYNGYQCEQRRKLYRDSGIEILHATGSGMILYKVLAHGGAVLLSMDVPGNKRTPFLGKPVDMVDGTARLAIMADALILPAALIPLGRRWQIQVEEALDPRDFARWEELHLALASIHEEFIMRAPDHLETPGRLWVSATCDGWYAQ
jgi:lauroyl/myristoyl acyltransferase